VQCQAALRFLLIAAAICAPLGGVGFAAESPRDFDAYTAEGYREVALFAERKADNPALAAHFKKRADLATAGRRVQPERLGAWKLDSWTTREAKIARTQLIAKLDGGARQRQPLLAAVAQVNFDCWLAPFPTRPGLRDSSECRRRFYIAFAQLQPVILPTVQPAATTQVASAAKSNRPASTAKTTRLASTARNKKQPGVAQVAPTIKLRPEEPVLATAFGSISCDASAGGDQCSQQFSPQQIAALVDDSRRGGSEGIDGQSPAPRKPGQIVQGTGNLGASPQPGAVAANGVGSSDVGGAVNGAVGGSVGGTVGGAVGAAVGGSVGGIVGGSLGGAPVGAGDGEGDSGSGGSSSGSSGNGNGNGRGNGNGNGNGNGHGHGGGRGH
jgi:hypothetical protein